MSRAMACTCFPKLSGFLAVLLLLAIANVQTQAFDVHEGCYSNLQQNQRALSFMAAKGIMTVPMCSEMAKTRFVNYYGLEYGDECWLDPQNGSFANLTRFGLAQCAMPCTGNKATICGDKFTVNLYGSAEPIDVEFRLPAAGYQDLGCYKDYQLARRMKLLWINNSSMTHELCAHIAYEEEWAVFGLQYSSECWGADNTTFVQALGATTACNMSCPGNSSQDCGGPWALRVFGFNVPPEKTPEPSPSPIPTPGASPNPDALGGGANFIQDGIQGTNLQPGASKAVDARDSAEDAMVSSAAVVLMALLGTFMMM